MGRVNGAQAPLMLPLGLVGLPLAGFVFDSTGSYQLVFAGCTALAVLAGVLIFVLPVSVLGLGEAEKE